MKRLILSILSIVLALSSVSAQEEVLWEGTPANVFDGRYALGVPFKEAGLQVGDALRVYLTDITEEQKIWLKIDGASVNTPYVMPVGTLYFDHVLTADNIAKIENRSSTNVSYNQGGLFVKFEKASGKV